MERSFSLPLALLSILGTVAIMLVCLVWLHTEPQIPLLLACILAAATSLIGGCGWKELGSGILRSVSRSLQAIVILLLIGALIGVWIAAGTVPAMVYYGLRLISPRFFLASSMLVCALISMVLGSWGTAGTVGLAFMGMAQAMGIPLPLAAGAVVSGSYVGDKLSPLADTTNLSAAVAEVDVMESIRNIFRVAAPAFLICLLLYGALGWRYGSGEAASSGEQILAVAAALGDSFHMTPLNFLPLLVLLVCMLCRLPAIPSLLAGLLSGAIYAVAVQHGELTSVLGCVLRGYVGNAGNTLVDQLLTAGGILSMLYTISIILLAMSFGGIMEQSGQMHTAMTPLLRRAKGFPALMTLTTLTACVTNVLLPDQYIAIALSGRMYAAAYDEQGFRRKDLAMAIGVGGALTSALVPWNTCGIFMSGILGVATWRYAPLAFYNYGMVLAVILYAALRGRKKAR